MLEVYPQGGGGGGSTPAQIGLDFRRMSVLTKFLALYPNNITQAINAWVANAFANGFGLYGPAGTYDLDQPISIVNTQGFEMLGEGRNRTIFRQSATWAANTYYAFDTDGCTILAGSDQLDVPVDTVEAFQDALTRYPAGPTIVVYGAGAHVNDRWETTYTAINGNTLTCSSTAPNNGTGIVRITPPPLLDLVGVEQAQIHGFNLQGRGGLGAAQLWAAIRCGSIRGDAPPVSVSQRNHFFDLSLGSCATGIEVFGIRDGNNDLCLIENSNFGNVMKFGVDLMDSQEFDWTGTNLTIYGDSDWITPKVCSIGAGSNVLTCPSGPFKTFHKGTLAEVDGAGFGGTVMPCFITRYISPTQVEVSRNAVVAVVNTAALHIGAQGAYHMGGPFSGGNITMRGGLFNGFFLRASMIDESFNGSNVRLEDGRDESCRAIYAQPLNGGIFRCANIDGYTLSQTEIIAERPVMSLTAGPFTARNLVIGQRAAGATHGRIAIVPTEPSEFQCVFDNVYINTEVPREQVFSNWDVDAGAPSTAYRPSEMRQVRIYNNAGVLTEFIDKEIRNEVAVTTASQPLVDCRVRVTWGNNDSPDLNSLYSARVYYDAGWVGPAPITNLVGAGPAGTDLISIPDRSLNFDASRGFTPGSLVSKQPQLQAMGKYGRRGWRFDFGRALFIPPAAFGGMTEAEIVMVAQRITLGGGCYSLGISADGIGPSEEHPYTDRIWYEDGFRDYRLNSAALPQATYDDLIIVRIVSKATAGVGDFKTYINDVLVINGGPGTNFHLPASPVVGAGANNVAGTTPSSYGNFVLGTLLVSDTVNDAAYAQASAALREYYGM